jgi:hypothetical protein
MSTNSTSNAELAASSFNLIGTGVGESRSLNIDSNAARVWDFLEETKYLGDLEDDEVSDKSRQLFNLLNNYSRKEILGKALCSEDFISKYGDWLLTEPTKNSRGGLAPKYLTSGTVLDHLSAVKGILFNFFPTEAKELYQSPTVSSQTTVRWYTELRSKLVQRCHLRDVREYGSLQEGVKKHSLGKELVISTGKADLRFNKRENTRNMIQRGTVFNNAGTIL